MIQPRWSTRLLTDSLKPVDAAPQLPTPSAHGDQARRWAAVAIVAHPCDDGDIELLFIQRAANANDPWSGQMAFPGGRYEATDRTLVRTAERETEEEIGLDLTAATALGTLTELDGGQAAATRLVSVSAIVYWYADTPPRLQPNYEVADTVWVPTAQLLDPHRYIDYYYPRAEGHFPGIQLERPGQVIWGLTLRLLGDFFGRLDQPFIVPGP